MAAVTEPGRMTPGRGASPRRLAGSLTTRIGALALAAVLLTSVVGAAAAVILVQRATDRAAVASLAALADSAQAVAALAPSPEVGQARAARALDGVRVQVAVVRVETVRGTVVTGDPLARRALNADQLGRLIRGESVSAAVTTDDGRVLVEARSTGAGGIVLAQRRSDAAVFGQQAVTQMIWAFVVVGAAALVASWLVARRIGAPLREVAAAASELAAGRRDVAVSQTGPSEVVEVAVAVNGLARSLAHSEARQREFLLSVSHDLRTPLTTLRGYAESLADDVVPADSMAQVGAVMQAEAARLERMVGDLLDLARLDAQEARLHLVTLSVRDLVLAAEAAYRHRCEAVGVVLRVDLPEHRAGSTDPDGPGADVPSGDNSTADVPSVVDHAVDDLVVEADPDRLRQALDGLFDNALRATPADRPIVVAAYRVLLGPEGRPAVAIQVRDGGPGLADEDYPVAFGRSVLYERYRGVRDVGTGLGLAIVARIAARHHGTVRADPAPEGGAAFTLTLPAAEPGVQPGGAHVPGR